MASLNYTKIMKRKLKEMKKANKKEQKRKHLLKVKKNTRRTSERKKRKKLRERGETITSSAPLSEYGVAVVAEVNADGK